MIKKFLPKTIFFRYLLIIIAPILLLQIILTIVFFDSLWIKTNKGLTKSVAAEINAIIEVYNDKTANKNFEFVKNLFELSLIQEINILKDQSLPFYDSTFVYSLYDQLMDEELAKEIKFPYWYNTRANKDYVDIRIQINKNVLQFIVHKSRVRNSSARIFILWITIPSILLLMISILFLRNQVRPFSILADSAEKFGKGQYVPELKPSGAVEVRKAIIEFEKMKRRILRHISQRTAMLSGISHDLKTPLTRLKLQIEIMNKNHSLDKIKDDVIEMEKMIAEYLDYSSSQEVGASSKFDLSNLMTEIVHKFNNKNITLKCPDKIYLTGKKQLVKRCVYNLIDNAIKYAGNANVIVKKGTNDISIIVEDDGPGVPDHEKDRILRPFYKLDKSRTMVDGSVGLGLSIVQDIINSHGGKIKINDNSKNKGLKVTLSFPD
ncbi:MAG: ATP-binding protein [Proteobacteria bacterium]|jgi:two-component system, OmpR family, osmolarity sensor histidine kinase EnvZ|nr:ATP-binding protein [Pseudomonadota bacterium]